LYHFSPLTLFCFHSVLPSSSPILSSVLIIFTFQKHHFGRFNNADWTEGLHWKQIEVKGFKMKRKKRNLED